MFTRSVRVGCSFPACRGESVNFQTCSKMHPKFIHLKKGLSGTLQGLSVTLPGLSLSLAGLS